MAKHVSGSAARMAAVKGLALALASASMFGLATQALAQSHGPHVHGAARLNVAIDGHSVWLEATLPAADVVGFEHAPESAADEAAVAAAVDRLKNAEALYRLPAAAGCRLVEAAVASELLEPEAEHDHDKGHDHDHDKDRDADHAHGKGHDHDKDEAEPDVHGHADFIATAIFRCDAPAEAVHVDVALFEAFPTLHEVDAQAVVDAGQLAAELTPAAARFGLR